MNSAVKEVVQKAHSKNEETRKNKRLEAQSSRRQLCKDDFCHEISEKEFKTLTNLCKSGKLSVSQWRDLSQALNSKADHCKLFVDSDGCLHALVGQLTGSEPSKQVRVETKIFEDLGEAPFKEFIMAQEPVSTSNTLDLEPVSIVHYTRP